MISSRWTNVGNFLQTKLIILDKKNGFKQDISDFVKEGMSVVPYFSIAKMSSTLNPISKIDFSYEISKDGILSLTGGIYELPLFNPNDAGVLGDNFFEIKEMSPSSENPYVNRISNNCIEFWFKSKKTNSFAVTMKALWGDSKYNPPSDFIVGEPFYHKNLNIKIKFGERIVYDKTTSGYNHHFFANFFRYENEQDMRVIMTDLDGAKIHAEGLGGIFMAVGMFLDIKCVGLESSIFKSFSYFDSEINCFLIKRS